MWHPALDGLRGEIEVVLHHAGTARRLSPAPVTLPDGTRLVPLGKLRGHRPVALCAGTLTTSVWTLSAPQP
ncbi:hypothetical protein [Streptomyces sp. ME18-1-4]|uniref:hypothetical protein n=1 Tax=Streptomyces sp. ME18-1-4 TaxID=3028685 RepID=UPI0029A77DD6|nr:hypothetical protein [Streptomyces sp. ME18-1-4]MDX3246766.1 hypothetical protein [Streptomyces sp. ME18-1-4]